MGRIGTAALAAGLILILVTAGCAGKKGRSTGIASQLEDTVAFYQEKESVDEWWEAVALYGAGAAPVKDRWKAADWAKRELPPHAPATAYAGLILGILALDENPWDLQGRNLVAELASLQKDDGSFGGSVNQSIWAVIALETSGFTYRVDDALLFLRGEQKTDGGFALSGGKGDVDVTAMALMALAFHRGTTEVELSIERALDFLAEERLASGGYASWGEENSNSIAVVISALVALGEDPGKPPWENEGGGLLAALLACQLSDGSFSYSPDSLKSDPMATCQSLIALGDAVSGRPVFMRLREAGEKFRPERTELQQAEPPGAEPAGGALERGAEVALVSAHPDARIFYATDGSEPGEDALEYVGPLKLESETTIKARVFVPGMKTSETAVFKYTFKKDGNSQPANQPSPPAEEEDFITVEMQVTGKNKSYFSGTVKVPAEKANVLQALIETGLKVETMNFPLLGNYVSAIENEEHDLNTGSGWVYTVNSREDLSAADEKVISEGDVIHWKWKEM